ncbi:MAG: hypothetical protein AzoDbin1_01298 [Azoarcus sp.]|uniref:Uncharacterized protein n=1 Tax=Aromatoleum tolulyticum TaxID=34027 RepID=A0A1N6SYK1_9RHOO|nr:hypothetical protein [Aromatoleum tolulyticum]MCK9984826.1 hypothetical protein [Azoarcus sp.]SIQ46173.1 hypothetical protein SAMN05421829_104263 [Aromatoleum tolulyticum]
MKPHRSALLLLFVLPLEVFANGWEFDYRPAQAGFATYGNSLGDPVAASKQDTKIAFEIRGQAAREMFEAMGPDRQDSCSKASDVRFRFRDDEKIVCTRGQGGKYACYFGFDLKTGKSIGGSIC